MRQKTVEVTLEFPVQLPDTLLTVVTVRRPTMRDILESKVANDDDVEGEMRMFSRLTKVNVEDLKNLDVDDYARLQEAVISFRTAPKG